MRDEYTLMADLFWQFGPIQDKDVVALKSLGISASDLQEERLRRFIRFSQRLIGIAPVFQRAICAWTGKKGLESLFEYTWIQMKVGRIGYDFVADTFHPEIIARAVQQYFSTGRIAHALKPVEAIFQLELGRYRARLVATGQADPYPMGQFVPGATAMLARFDLPGVFANLQRLTTAQLPENTIKLNVAFRGNPTLTVIQAISGEVVEHNFAHDRWLGADPRTAVNLMCPELGSQIYAANV